MTALPSTGAPSRPARSLVTNVDVVPAELRLLDRWVCWKYVLRDGKWTKAPFNPRDGNAASSTDPSTWASFDEAMIAARTGAFDGVSFAFVKEGPYVGIDLDECIDEAGRISPEAQTLIESFGTYTEISPSGRGVKMFLRGTKGSLTRCRSKVLGGCKEVEVYDHARVFTVTGRQVPGTSSIVADAQAALDALCQRLWPPKPAAEPRLRLAGTATNDLGDDDIIRRAGDAKNGKKFRALWAGDTSAYGGDDSAADLALCSILAFWADRDADRIDALFRRSGLLREKWERDDYRTATIATAISSCSETYSSAHGTSSTPTNADAPDAAARPLITIDIDEHRVIDETIEALTRDRDLFQRGSRLVRVLRSSTRKGLVSRPEGSGTIEELPQATLRESITRCTDLQKYNSRGDLVPAHPPEWLGSGIAARGYWDGIRSLVGLADAPLLRADGSVLQEPGYDEATGVLLRLEGAFPSVPQHPTRDDALKAVEVLLEIVCDYRFEADCHRATYVAALLTWLARYAFDGPSPLFLVDANVRGAGKGLLVQTIGFVAIGREMPVSSYCHDSEEMRKKITAIAIAGDSGVLLDNLEGVFGNDALDRALTCTTWRDRILGKSQQIELPLLPVWYATGNNVVFGADTARRVVPIRLDVLEENPENRSDFRHPNLLAWVRAERGRLLTAALTILSGYIRAGCPSQNLTPIGSYEGWSNLVRQAVVWAGQPDPCESRASLCKASDTTADCLRQLIGAWRLYAPSPQGVVVASMLDQLYPPHRDSAPRHAGAVAMRAALEALTGSAPGRAPDARRVGNRFKGFRRRVVDGSCIDMVPTERNRAGATWRLFTAAEAQRPAGLRVSESPNLHSAGEFTGDDAYIVNDVPD